MNDDLARKRFMTIQMVRLLGAAMVVVGLMVIGGRLDWPLLVGYFLLLNGLFDALFLPILLAKRWKSPKE